MSMFLLNKIALLNKGIRRIVACVLNSMPVDFFFTERDIVVAPNIEYDCVIMLFLRRK